VDQLGLFTAEAFHHSPSYVTAEAYEQKGEEKERWRDNSEHTPFFPPPGPNNTLQQKYRSI